MTVSETPVRGVKTTRAPLCLSLGKEIGHVMWGSTGRNQQLGVGPGLVIYGDGFEVEGPRKGATVREVRLAVQFAGGSCWLVTQTRWYVTRPVSDFCCFLDMGVLPTCTPTHLHTYTPETSLKLIHPKKDVIRDGVLLNLRPFDTSDN